MASPQESITTVSGRRCTRSRARTAATSSILTTSTQEAAVVTPTETTTSTTAADPPQTQTSAAQSPPPPPPSSSPLEATAAPSPSTVVTEPPVAAPTTTQATVPTAIGTLSSAPISSVPTTPLANPAPSQPTAAGPKRPVEISRPAAAAVSPATEATTTTLAPAPAPAPTSTSTSSDTIPTALQPPASDPSDPSSLPVPLIATSGAAESAILQSSLAIEPTSPSQIDTPVQPTSINTSVAVQPQPTTAPASSLPSGDVAAGIIGPEQGTSASDGGLTLPTSGDANIGSIVGGVVGGVAGLALICALLFFCLRKRKSTEPRWSEKNVQGPRFLEKIKAKATGVAIIFAKVKGVKKGPAKNPYQRHSQQDSISSVYSNTDSSGFYAPGDFMKRSASRKSERNRLRKKNSSVSSQSTLTGIMAETDKNPFADPEPPRVLRLSNPDASPRGPLTPQPAITSARLANDPFTSPFDGLDLMLPVQGHARTQSQASALSSQPSLFMFPTRSNSVAKQHIGLPPPSQPPQPSQNRRSSMALPSFDTTSTAASGESDYTLYGEPGPSRRGTGMFTPGLPTGRTVRQSDPFDLDRPEVLGFGNVLGRKEVGSSVTRQATRGKRTSSMGNWASVKDGYGPFSSWNSAPRR
jgi:hypothetical protein